MAQHDWDFTEGDEYTGPWDDDAHPVERHDAEQRAPYIPWYVALLYLVFACATFAAIIVLADRAKADEVCHTRADVLHDFAGDDESRVIDVPAPLVGAVQQDNPDDPIVSVVILKDPTGQLGKLFTFDAKGCFIHTGQGVPLDLIKKRFDNFATGA